MTLLLTSLVACAPAPQVAESASPAPTVEKPPPQQVAENRDSAQDEFWRHLSALCGRAFGGDMVTDDQRDADMVGWALYMHVRRCSDQRIEIPFIVGENRSRTWVLTRTENGLKLEHDHRHEDGSPDTVTLYGGVTEEPGTGTQQSFPADDYSQQLFEENGLIESMYNVWSLEITPGRRFTYILRRPGRYFRADFDLEFAVPAPPPPWGY